MKKNSERVRTATTSTTTAHRAKHTPIASNIQLQLMLFLCCTALTLLLAVWVLSTNLLQPYYNARIRNNLGNQLHVIVKIIDDISAEDITIFTPTTDCVVIDPQFSQAINDAIASGNINLSNICIDIADTSCSCVFYNEDIYPCLLHANRKTAPSDAENVLRNNQQLSALHKTCRKDGTLYKIIASGDLEQMVVGKTTANGTYSVIVSISLTRVSEADTVLQQFLPSIGVFLFFITLIASWLFSRWFSAPITQLSQAARQMTHGNYAFSIHTRRNDELGALTDDFQLMAQEIERTALFQRELLANVSHDLRTPLTLITGYAETIRDLTGENTARRNEQLNIIINESNRLNRLVDSILELSKVSHGSATFEYATFDLRQLCEEVSERYDAICTQNNFTLKLSLPSTECLIYADPMLLERALHNLLGNAIQHLGKDGIFILRVTTLPQENYRVEVQDFGKGIPPEEIPYIFDRYYRSRTNLNSKGTGLGLSITKAIFQKHNFPFGVDSTLGHGATFWFETTTL